MPVELMALMANPQASQPDPAVLAKVTRWYRGLLRDLRVERYSLQNIAVTAPDADVRISGMALGGIVARGFDLFEIKGVDVKTLTGAVKLVRFALEKVNYGALLDLGLEAAETGREPNVDPSKILELLPQIAALRLAGIDAATPEGPVTLDSLDFELDDQPGRVPERLALAINRLIIPINSTGPGDGREQLVKLGYKVFRSDAKATLRWLPTDKALVLDDTTIIVDEAGRVDIRVRFDGVDLAAAVADPQHADAILKTQAMVRGIELAVINLGFAERLFADLAKSSGVTPDAIRDSLVAEIKNRATEIFGAGLSPGYVDKLAAFIRKPKRITVKAAPRAGQQPIKVMDIEMLGPQILDRVAIDIEVGPVR
jgi:hypothetical protein